MPDALDDSCAAVRGAAPLDGPGKAPPAISFEPNYIVTLSVNLPPCFMPWVDPKSLPGTAGLDFDLATEETLDRFMVASNRILAERQQLVDACFREWRVPTPSEEEHFADLLREFEIVQAVFEKTLTIIQ